MVDSSEPSENNIKKANALKEEGNECVKASKFNDAIEKYTEAIKLNRDPVLCNRAAAYCRLEKFDLAIEDCRSALELDENYAKAYGRMGLAYLSQDRNEDAVEAYKKALELDPTGESYKMNLEIAEEKIREANRRSQSNPGANQFSGFPGLGNLLGGGGAGGMPDLSALMNDPQMVQATMEMMNDPNMQNLMGSMMEQFMGGSAGGAGGGGFDDLIAAGQNMAQQMQQANPELVEQLREQFATGSPPPMTDPSVQNLMAPMMEQFMGAAGGGGFNDLLAAGQSMAQQMQQANPELIERLRQQFSRTSAEEGNEQNQDNNPSNPDNNEQQ
uniref:STI1 domain-containing protein n=1 Tax=Panagrolaimus davidi TaxID=227884 RepID=A0A914PDE3_9BILA